MQTRAWVMNGDGTLQNTFDPKFEVTYLFRTSLGYSYEYMLTSKRLPFSSIIKIAAEQIKVICIFIL